ncbi:MAG: cobyrinate a,c-diamide synthase [Alphaproteobacteria bacterium]
MTAKKSILMLAATASNSGKTLIMLGLLRALKHYGIAVAPAKSGPDYIDPAFHSFASGEPSVNLDGFAMNAPLLQHLVLEQAGDCVLIEAAMGLYDGSDQGKGSAAALASTLDCPIILILNAKGSAQSTAMIAASLIKNHQAFYPAGRICGVIFNQVLSKRHGDLILGAAKALNLPLLGLLPFQKDLTLENRHLGLIQASELDQASKLEPLIERASQWITQHIDLDQIMACFKPLAAPANLPFPNPQLPAPPAQHIAIAKDAAFNFLYPHLVMHWRKMGANLYFFSPLNNEAPPEIADFILLAGGYPELFLKQIMAATDFKTGLLDLSARNIPIYGECGGYMLLGEAIIDKHGKAHKMLGLLPHVTSFEAPRLHLGYRYLTPLNPAPFGRSPSPDWHYIAHEFHYSAMLERDLPQAPPLFSGSAANGDPIDHHGSILNHISGSYHHIIAQS